jgi:hypothetical protein
MKILKGLIILLVLGACNRNDALVRWDADLKIPLAKASLGLQDLLPDSLIIAESDSSLHLIYQQQFAIDSFGDILNVPDTLNEVVVKLQQLVLSEQTLEDTVALSDIYPPARLLNGQEVVLPAQDLDGSGSPQIIDVSQEFFRTAVFKDGIIEITLHNDLPVEAEMLVFKLSNQDDQATILADTFLDILPGESRTEQYSLAGKKVNGIMVGEIQRVKTKASNGTVLIEANKGVRIQMRVFNLEPEFATAIFPAQVLVADSQETIYDLNDVKVTEMHLKGGYIIMDVISTIEEEIILDYYIPNSRNSSEGGIPIKKVYNVPPAPPGQTSRIREKFPMQGFTVIYKGKDPNTPPYWNTVFSVLTARIEYSGIERTLSLSDSVRVRFGLVEVDPDYAIGDFGNRVNELRDSLDIPILRKASGSLNLEDIRVDLQVENSFGIDAQLDFLEIKGVNTAMGKAVKLQAEPINGPFMVRKATNPPLRAGVSSFTMDKTNSNLRQFVSILPDQIKLHLRATSSPFGTQNLSDFVFSNSQLKADLKVDVPIVFGADSVLLSQQICLGTTEKEALKRAGEGYLVLEIDNGLPFQLGVGLEAPSGKEPFADYQDHIAAAAVFDLQTNKVQSSRKSEIRIKVDRNDLLRLLENECFDLKLFIHSEDVRRYPIHANERLNMKMRYEGAYEVEI